MSSNKNSSRKLYIDLVVCPLHYLLLIPLTLRCTYTQTLFEANSFVHSFILKKKTKKTKEKERNKEEGHQFLLLLIVWNAWARGFVISYLFIS